MMAGRATRPRVVIVGGGFAGLSAAHALRNADAEIVLIDRHNHHLFQPLLYQIATAALSPGNIAAPIRRILSTQANCTVVMAPVTGVDIGNRSVTLGEESYRFDYLILAAGARTNYFGNDSWAEHAPGLKTIDEAVEIRARFLLAFEQAEFEEDAEAKRAALTFAIVGAGATGVEMAGALAEISESVRKDFRNIDTRTTRIILIDYSDRVLSTFDAKSSKRARRDLESLHVEVMLNTRVVHVDAEGLTAETPAGTVRIEARNVIWAAGVKASPLGAALGTEQDSLGRVVVEDDLTIAGVSHVFVVGDLASRIDSRTGEAVPGVAQGAIQMGRFAGQTIAAEIEALSRGRPAPARKPFVYKDKGSLAIIGRNRAIAEIGKLRFGGFSAFLAWALIHVRSLIGFRRRFAVFAEWVWLYIFQSRGVRLITGEDRMPRPVKPPPDRRA